MKKRIGFLLLLLFFLILTLSGCFIRDAVNRASFEDLMDEYFYLQLSDPMTVNFTLKDSGQYGLDTMEVTPYVFSEEEYQQYRDYLRDYQKRLNGVKYQTLTPKQQITYDIVIADLENTMLLLEYPYHLSNLGIYFGYQVQLPIVLGEYHFFNKSDITNYFQYLSTAKATFHGMIDFEKTRIEKGYGYPPEMYHQMAEQCMDLLDVEEIFLISIFNKKIDDTAFLSPDEKADYKIQHLGYIDKFIDAYTYLQAELAEIEVPIFRDGGLSSYPDGAALYEIIVKDVTGCDMAVDNIYEYISAKFRKEFNYVTGYVRENPDKLNDLLSPDFISSRDRAEIYTSLKENTTGDFPPFTTDLAVRFEDIHPSLRDNVAPAFYFLSPIDADVTEVIYINDAIFENPTAAYFTIGHESIPGHMLQHNILKRSELSNVRKVLNFTGYAEGWAVYVEEYIGKYLDVDNSLLKAYFANERLNYLFFCLADIEIHYYDMTMGEFSAWLKDYFGEIPSEACQEFYFQIKEEPGYFLQYYLSYYLLFDLKNNFSNKMAEYKIDTDHPDYDFHKYYLSFGPAPFYIMDKWLDYYINENYQ
ncbi:MAG: DUF885 family protein [Bacilli bacterium]|nr:DUF885 family protein [Bacilli bacterium]MDD4388806.1 DUF885 family protein [Bacilli bacterium]